MRVNSSFIQNIYLVIAWMFGVLCGLMWCIYRIKRSIKRGGGDE